MLKSLLVLLLLNFVIITYGQSRKELEEQRMNNLKEISFTNKLIKEAESNKKYSYNKLLLINKKIKSRNEIINSINEEIDYLDNNIELQQEIIIGLENDMTALKKEYAKMIYYSYLHRSNYDKLMFILASDNFNAAFKRIKYLQQYSEYRIKQADEIESTKKEIGDKIVELEILKADKKDLLVEKSNENQKLITEKNQKNAEVKKFSNRENELRVKLKKQNEVTDRLNAEIKRIIEEEARKAAENAKNKGNGLFKLTPEEKLIADIFYKNQSHLPWPTERGVITGDFGEQPHPFLKGIKIRNDGIDISTTEGALARAIFDGMVSAVVAIPGAHKTVLIRHGNYLTVYSNLKDVFVKQGEKVKTKQSIGVVYTENDKEHKTVLQFQIRKETEPLNPVDWLAKSSNG